MNKFIFQYSLLKQTISRYLTQFSFVAYCSWFFKKNVSVVASAFYDFVVFCLSKLIYFQVSEYLGDDWIRLAGQLEVSMSQVNRIKTEYCDSTPAQQGLLMLKQWVQEAGNKASGKRFFYV